MKVLKTKDDVLALKDGDEIALNYNNFVKVSRNNIITLDKVKELKLYTVHISGGIDTPVIIKRVQGSGTIFSNSLNELYIVLLQADRLVD